MEEIKDVLEKHDICGVVMLASQTHVEHFTKVHASWSCARYDGEMVRFYAKLEDFPSLEAQKECVTDTIGIMVGLMDVCRDMADQLQKLLEHLSHKFQITHRTRAEE